MKRATTFTIDNVKEFRNKMLNWVKPFNIFCLLDNNGYQFDNSSFESLLAVGCKASLTATSGNAFEQLKAFNKKQNDWLFGHFAYDLKNENEQLISKNFDGIGFDDLHFFVPEIVLQLNHNAITIYCEGDAHLIFSRINLCSSETVNLDTLSPIIKNRYTRNEYIAAVQKLKEYISRGDCYEVNFCQEFFSEHALIDPYAVYEKINTLSPNPFAALYKFNDKYCICASPERYIKKIGNQVFSQPIKGTAKRFVENNELDELSKNALLNSEKEKSENVMVVDLVRNDLSKICLGGSVQVKELFGLYSFPQVHQMVSTISGDVTTDTDWTDIIKATFPMGSMTGAPKKRVMEIIEENERTRRGLFSGAIGYVDPKGDFDFNVVIRSILYNQTTKYLSFQAGSAITFFSDADQEYEECILKAAVIQQVLK